MGIIADEKNIKTHFSREFQPFEFFFSRDIRNGTNKKEEMVQNPHFSDVNFLKLSDSRVSHEVFLPRRKKRKKSKKEGKLEVLPF